MSGADRPPAGSGAILMYHRVASLDSDVFGLAVRPETLREHMLLLNSRFRPMPLRELALHAPDGTVPRGAVAVTFDDGYADDGAAADILCALGVPATFFVTTAWLDEPGEFWWDVLERVFLGDHTLPHRLPPSEPDSPALPTTTPAERATALRTVHASLVHATLEERERRLRDVRVWSGLDLAPRESHRPMSHEDVRRLAGRPGLVIGAHTVQHLALPAQPADVQRREVHECKARLEEATGGRVTTFSYPFGLCDDGVVEIVRAAGFAAAVTARTGLTGPGVDPLRLPRLAVGECDADVLDRRLATAFEEGLLPPGVDTDALEKEREEDLRR